MTQISRNIFLTIGLYFVQGICTSANSTIIMTYMNETVTENKRVMVTTLLSIGNSFPLIIQVVYYYFFKDSYILYWFIFAATLSLTSMLVFIPESPKYLYAHNYFDKARRSLHLIAEINGIEYPEKIKYVKFDRE